MTVPGWMNAAIGDFGRASGLDSLSLNERGAAALRFETGAALRLEYTGSELVMAMTVPAPYDLKRLLALAHPMARHGFRIRAGVMPRTQEGVLATMLAERDVTLPQLNAAFGVLWRLAGEMGGAR